MKLLADWVLEEQRVNGVTLLVEGQHFFIISALDHQFFRVSLLKDQQWRLNRSWTICPEGEIPWEGRSRDSESGFLCPNVKISNGEPLVIATDSIRVSIHRPLRMVWDVKIDDHWHQFAEDRKTGAILLGRQDHAVHHFMTRHVNERAFGLGEKSGPLERDGRRYQMCNLDALGYNARTTDPLYKHVPFLMVQTPSAGCWSIFYDNFASCWFDLHQERDNYHAPYRAWRAEDGDLDFYLRWEESLLALTKAQVKLTGGTCFPPRWSLGYSASSMAYTDADDAQAQLLKFPDQLKEHQIPCDSFHMSSGYTSIDGKRYVFNWNRDKFPDPHCVSKAFSEQGIHLIANIKPCLLNDHPRYEEAASKGLFIRDSETGQPERSAFWGDWGSHLDFSNIDTIGWWKQNVTEQLLDQGIESTWNDNNEYEIWDRQAQCNGFGDPIDISLIRPLHSQWMCRASEEAQRAHSPEKRPYLICRSGAPGIQRYAQTWTGDNYTSWETLKWNIRMGLGLSLSGFYNIGHDVGGFAGPKPEPELFLRWVQNGIFHPRFSIHSWNDDGTVNEPWMYPEITPLIREAIQLRYKLMPYLYTCLWKAVTHHEPMLRPTFLDHPDDERCYEDCDDFMLGSDLLVASVVEKGQTVRPVYLPKNKTGWWDYFNRCWYAGGDTIQCSVQWNSIPLFVRAGAVMPINKSMHRTLAEVKEIRELLVFPFASSGRSSSWLFEDDGETSNAIYSLLCFDLLREDDQHHLHIAQQGSKEPTFSTALLSFLDEVSTITIDGDVIRSGDSISLSS